MAEALAQNGHYPRTQDQVRSKVKELRQGYVKAREESSHSGAAPYYCPYYSELDQILGGGGEARTPRRFVQSGLADPVVDAPEQDPEHSGDGDMVPEEDSEETATLTLEPVTQTPEASQVSSGAGDEAAAGPAVQEGRSTPAPPPSPSRGHGSRRHRSAVNTKTGFQSEGTLRLRKLNFNLHICEAGRHLSIFLFDIQGSDPTSTDVNKKATFDIKEY
ncbi:uncharacterized protein LOC142826994 [Pelodiscus sinensis]|uniref:uncharacterized protein LOC142826994 n=1 Tax=Pelodiscus sinensis TaxID=13735 RepID=UPI003F6DA39C